MSPAQNIRMIGRALVKHQINLAVRATTKSQYGSGLVIAERLRGLPCVSVRLLSYTEPKRQIRSVHMSTPSRADAVDAATVEGKTETEELSQESGGIIQRFFVTGEVTISKIFPAGFGWQTASIMADNLGYTSDSATFALTTGIGDAVGVLFGHIAYYGLKKLLVDSSISMKREVDIGVLLASAAFCSGSAWQPVVCILQGANLPFAQVFAGTWVACGTAFYLGLRAGRTILSGVLEHVHEPTYENSKTDASLSLAIGGATGYFVALMQRTFPSKTS